MEITTEIFQINDLHCKVEIYFTYHVQILPTNLLPNCAEGSLKTGRGLSVAFVFLAVPFYLASHFPFFAEEK